MVLLESNSIKMGLKMPSFELLDVFETQQSLNNLSGEKGTVIIFTCNHCPYAKAIWDRLIELYHDVNKHGIQFIAINPNINPDYPEDSPSNMKKLSQSLKLPFSYLVDANQSVAKSYQAACTPDIYLLDSSKSLFYHGALDNNWQNPLSVTQSYLKKAINCLILNEAINFTYPTSMGCSIKWL